MRVLQTLDQLARTACRRAGVLPILLASVACTTVDAPQTRGAFGAASEHNSMRHAGGFSAIGMTEQAAEILKTANASANDIVSIETVSFQRAEVAATAIPAVIPHEAGFASSSEAKLANITGQSRATDASSIIQTQAANQGGWREGENEYVHAHSGMKCPLQFSGVMFDEEGGSSQAEILLSGILVFDNLGHDTACNYMDTNQSVALTFYASKWAAISLDDHFGSSIKNILDRFAVKTEAPLVVTDIERDGKSTIKGDTKGAAFILQPQDGVTFKTALWLNQTGDWHVKARATYPVAVVDEEPQFSVLELMAAIYHSLKLAEVDGHINSAAAVEVAY